MILMTVIMNLLPDKKYEKYLQLFTGMVFLLLVFSPFTNLTGLEEQIAGSFERITFQTDAKMLREEIEDADGRRMELLTERYRMVIEQELLTLVEAVQAECKGVKVTVETDPESGEFGALREVRIVFYAGESEGQEHRMAVNRQIAELKARIGTYYGMEERNIAVNLETQ